MATLTIVKFFFQLFLIFICAYGILHEKELVKLERKAVKYVKAFFKAAYLCIKEKKNTKSNVTPININTNAEYEEMLLRLNKASKLEDVFVA